MSDLTPELQLGLLRGDLTLSAAQFGGLMRGAHQLDPALSLPPELSAALALREAVSRATTYDPATHDELITHIGHLNDHGEWLSDHVQRYPREEFSALARTVVCAAGLQASYAQEPEGDAPELARRWARLLSHLLIPEWSEALLTELGFPGDFAFAARRLTWPGAFSNELIFGTTPPHLRRWHQRLHPMERLNLISMTLYAERCGPPDSDWGGPSRPDNTPAGVLGRFMALTRLQRRPPSEAKPGPAKLGSAEFQQQARALTDVRLPAPGTPHRHSDLLLSVLLTMTMAPEVAPDLARNTRLLLEGGPQVIADLRVILWQLKDAVPEGSPDPWHAALRRLRSHWNAIDG